MRFVILNIYYPPTSLKNFGFLVPHLPEFEGELKDLLFEIDKLIERKKCEWENELKTLEQELLQKVKENQTLQEAVCIKEREVILSDHSAATTLHEAHHCRLLPKHFLKRYMLISGNELFLYGTREEHTIQLEMLKQQLLEEKNMSTNLRDRCTQLQSQLNDAMMDLDRERKSALEAQLTFLNRQSELEAYLQTAHSTAESQAKELLHVKQVLTANQAQIWRLSSEASAKQSELVASKAVVKNLETAVAKHLAIVSAEYPPSPTSNSPGVPSNSGCTQTSDFVCPGQLEEKLVKLERQLSSAHKTLREKLQECSRLEVTCHTASATIQRLVDVKNQAMRQVASLGIALGKTSEALNVIYERVSEMDQTCTEKLLTVKKRLDQLKEQVIQSLKLSYSMTIHHPSISFSTWLTALMQPTVVPTTIIWFRKDLVKAKRYDGGSVPPNTQTNQLDKNRWLTTSGYDFCSQLSNLQSAKRYDSTSTQTESPILLTERPTQTDPNLTTPPQCWPASKVQLLRNDWMASVQQLHSKIEALKQERDDLRIRLEHQISFVERLQKENLALTDVLTGAENFNRTRISCASPAITSPQSSRPAYNLPNLTMLAGQQQNSELHSLHSSVQSVTIESPAITEPEPNRSCDLPTSPSLPVPLEAQNDKFLSSDIAQQSFVQVPLSRDKFSPASTSSLQANSKKRVQPHPKRSTCSLVAGELTPPTGDHSGFLEAESHIHGPNRCRSRGSSMSISCLEEYVLQLLDSRTFYSLLVVFRFVVSFITQFYSTEQRQHITGDPFAPSAHRNMVIFGYAKNTILGVHCANMRSGQL
ncbi:centrosomal protein of 63 kDa [Clonorchis sinensis]|uniref:Centrosomal protein of 63 kDa n=1 Tax=Clonorchis sinensis TaxID=79923 RepID=G7Y3N2_CLOSI|nr:centrosomal protein of 63 kDa [Clonorchis sinensis]